ncbi:GIP [Symbiodinium sp. CCMP2592]|nr:GIP [Symbiodinium sp. CCMP2592]
MVLLLIFIHPLHVLSAVPRVHCLQRTWLELNILDNGHVVYVEETPENKEKFMHTFHVRHRLVDPGPPQEELEVQTPLRPRRRVTEKKPMEQVELRHLALSQEERDDYIARKARFLLDDWDQEGAVRLVDELAEVGFFDEWKFGVFRHGGSVGWLRGLRQYPELSQVLSRIVLEVNPEANFTAIWVARNAERGLHKDYNNDENAVNYVYPIRMPRRGGELWVELSPGDRVDGEIMDRTDSLGKRRYGYLKKLQHGSCTVFSPRRAHEVLPWTGTRTVLIAYTPQCMGRLSTEMIQELETRGFQPPLSQYPEYFLAQDPQPMEAKVEVQSHDQVEYATAEDLDGSDVEELWEMYLDVDGGKVKIGDDETEHREQPRPRFMKVEAGFTKNVEAILQELKGPIEVTYNVDPKEVADNMGLWMGAIQKELDGVSVAIKKLLPNTEERVKWMRRPGAQKLPAKFVYTVKPAENPDSADKATWFKRKARLVVCGNYASPDQSELYSETAPSEAVRAGLVMSRRRKWMIGLIDVVAAFLRTPLNPEDGSPTIIVTPPRLLLRLNLIVEDELWGLIRALYGLRQAPALWSSHRDYTLRTMEFPHGRRLYRGRTVTAWWVLKDERGSIKALVIIYVDDILLLGEEETIREVAETIQGEWKTSGLAFLRPGHPLRFLGMELEINDEETELYVNQRSYIEEVLRAYGYAEDDRDKIPLSKEHAYFERLESDPEPTTEMISAAQKITGEIMWIAHKTRPDVAFTCSLMASITLKAPDRCLTIGYKVLRYLNATKDVKMIIKNDHTDLVLYPDAAFAPSSEKSHTGWVVCWSGTPIAWRSGRQSTIALSTAESELTAIVDGTIGMMGLEALLADLQVEPTAKLVASDSTSALAIGAGTGSWRTRHLRLKAAWVQDMIATGEVLTRHQPGLTQPADLLTKPLSSQRIKALLGLWGTTSQEESPPKGERAISTSGCSTRMMVAMVCCLLILTVEAREATPTRQVELDWDMAAVMMGLLMILGGLLLYEGVKWGAFEIYYNYTPGASSRRLRKLQKLREATSLAIQRELERVTQPSTMSSSRWEDGGERDQPPTRPTTTMSPPRQRRPVREVTPEPRRRTEPMRTPPTYDGPTEPMSSPAPSVGWNEVERVGGGSADDRRVCVDAVMLMRLEEIKEGLRICGLAQSGLSSYKAFRGPNRTTWRLDWTDRQTATLHLVVVARS